MIIVTGATGKLNGATAAHLLRQVDASEIAVVVRDPHRAEHFASRGVHVRHGDYAEPASLRAAFADADSLLLVSSSDPHSDHVALHRAAIDAAVQQGVGRIAYTSHQGAHSDSPFLPGRTHFATEQLLAESGISWTSLRNGFYLHSLDWLLGSWRETGVIRIPADGPVSWTSRDDSAEAAAAILRSDQLYDGPVTVTASSAPTFAEIADIASDCLNKSIDIEIVDADVWMADQIAAGQPEPMARFTLGMYQAAEQGYFAGTDPLLRELLGREPQSVRSLFTV